MLKTWRAVENLMGGGGGVVGAWRLSKNTCEGVHLIVKLLAISLQACKFTKLSFFTHIFQGFYLDFKLLFIVLFSRNHFMEGCFTFKWEGGRG